MGIFLLVLAIIVFVGGVGGGLAWFAAAADSGEKVGATATVIVAVIVALLFFVLGGIRSVPVKSVGVVTSFGKVENTLRPGLHWTLPWKSANILDETIQTTSWGTNGNPCLDVRIGGQQTACLKATIQWQVKDSAASQLFNDYDTTGNVQGAITNAVVVREFEQVVNQKMGDYNPIQDVAANTATGNSQFSSFGPEILSAMQHDIGSQINVIRVIIPFAQYDASTQSRLNAIQQQYAETAIANEQIVTNQSQSKANQAIAQSVSSSPGVLEAQCYNIVENAIKSGYALPAGFNCVGGAGFTVTGK